MNNQSYPIQMNSDGAMHPSSPATRKIVYSCLVSLDGFINGPNGELDWHVIDSEFMNHVAEQQASIDTSLFGRRMYQEMVFWDSPGDPELLSEAEREFSQRWIQQEKIVFSRTLEAVQGNARLAKGSLEDEIRTLKSVAGGDIEIGGAELASQAVTLDLVDEYQFYVQPALTGGGTRCFLAPGQRAALTLEDIHTFSSGVVFMHYTRPVNRPTVDGAS